MVVLNLFKKIKDFFVSQNDSFWISLLFSVALLASSLTIFGGDLNGRNLSTPFFYLSFILIFCWLVSRLVFTFIRRGFNELSALIILGIAFIFGLFNIIIQTPISSYSFNYFKKVIISVTVLVFIYLCSFGKFNSLLKYQIPILGIILTVEILVSYISGIGRIYANQTSKNLLFFTFGNSNAAGINFSLVILMNCCGLFVFKKIYWKIVFAVAICFMLFLLYQTHARNAIYAIVLCFLSFLLFSINMKKDKKLFDFILLLVLCISPILVASIYTALATKTSILDYLNYFLGNPGKNVTSRIITWVSAFKHLSGFHFLIGDYYNSTSLAIRLSRSIAGYQNSQIDFFIDEGLIPALLILFFVFVCSYHKFKYINKLSLKNYVPIIFWLFTIFSSIFEGGLFICMNVWYIFGFSFLSLDNFSNKAFLVKADDLSYHEITI